jgi:hypothetical protein
MTTRIPKELDWHPKTSDPAFDEGYQFVERNRAKADEFRGNAPMWYGWMVRQAFWCGVKWAREQKRSCYVSGRVTEDGKIEWVEDQSHG